MIREMQSAARLRIGILPAALLFVSAAVLVAADAPGQIVDGNLARKILEATGVKGGLVVHLGCGDGKLTAALRASDHYLIHGLDCDAADVKKAREHIQSLGLYGKVSVARLSGGLLGRHMVAPRLLAGGQGDEH